MRKPRIFDANRYPIRRGNCIDLLKDGESFYPRMLSAIDEAKHTVVMEQYLVNSGEVLNKFIEAFSQAVSREVNVVVLLDDFGSSGLSNYDRERIKSAGVHLIFYNPIRLNSLLRNLFRNHRKLLMVDGRVAYVGGAGLSDEFWIPQQDFHNTPWRDVMLEIRGPIIADWLDLFRHTIRLIHQQHINIEWKTVNDYCNLEDKDQRAQVLVASALGRQEISRAFIAQVRAAKQRVCLSTPYFVTTKKIGRALCEAASRGVDTRLLLPGPHSDHPWITYASQRFYPALLEAGVKIFEYQPGFSHSKIQLVDDWVSIGSCNLDRWNMHWNLDANQSVSSKAFSQIVADLLDADFQLCHHVTKDTWSRRPLGKRIKLASSSLLVKLIEKIFSRL